MRTRAALEALLVGDRLREMAAALRHGRGGAAEACAALRLPSVGHFLQYQARMLLLWSLSLCRMLLLCLLLLLSQVYLDLIEPRHSIFRGTPKEPIVDAERHTYAQVTAHRLMASVYWVMASVHWVMTSVHWVMTILSSADDMTALSSGDGRGTASLRPAARARSREIAPRSREMDASS